MNQLNTSVSNPVLTEIGFTSKKEIDSLKKEIELIKLDMEAVISLCTVLTNTVIEVSKTIEKNIIK